MLGPSLDRMIGYNAANGTLVNLFGRNCHNGLVEFGEEFIEIYGVGTQIIQAVPAKGQIRFCFFQPLYQQFIGGIILSVVIVIDEDKLPVGIMAQVF